MKSLRALLTQFVTLSLLTACSAGTPVEVRKDSKPQGPSVFAQTLAAQSWCNVQDNGQPFDPDRALVYNFKTNGEVAFRSLHIDRVNGHMAKLAETAGRGTWTFEKGVLTIRNGETGEVLTSRAGWVQIVPSVPSDAIWKVGLTPTEQTCLKSESLEDTAKSGIHCPCNFETIVENAKSVAHD